MVFQISTGNRADSARRFTVVSLFICAALGLATSSSAKAQEFSGFLEDYSDMEEISPNVFMASVPNAEERTVKFDAIMIDQPEFHVADDSKFTGLKPDEMKLIADTLRLSLMRAFEHSSYRLVSTPGPTTLYLRTGITDVGLKKKRMRLVQFTPIGLAATLVTSPLRDIMDKVQLKRFTIEAEMVESANSAFIGHMVDRSRGSGDKDEEASWDTVARDLDVAAGRLECRLENARLSPDAKKDCFAAFPFTD